MTVETNASKPSPVDTESSGKELAKQLNELRKRTTDLWRDLRHLVHCIAYQRELLEATTPPPEFSGSVSDLPDPGEGDCPYCGTRLAPVPIRASR